MRLEAEDGGGGDALGEAGALNDYFTYKEEVGTNLDLIPGVAAAQRQRKTKGQRINNASEGVTPQFQIWLSSTHTLSKTRTRTNPTYAFVLASRKRVNPGVEMHLALGFICW
jgi:hypothetical protein